MILEFFYFFLKKEINDVLEIWDDFLTNWKCWKFENCFCSSCILDILREEKQK